MAGTLCGDGLGHSVSCLHAPPTQTLMCVPQTSTSVIGMLTARAQVRVGFAHVVIHTFHTPPPQGQARMSVCVTSTTRSWEELVWRGRLRQAGLKRVKLMIDACRYVEGETSRAQKEWQLCDHVDGRSWWAETEGKDFVFFPGMDSPGGDYLVVEGTAQGKAGEVCRHVDHCLAYNSNGILKHSLLPPQQWVRWTTDPQHGLYVLDIDYCQLGLEQCPASSQCARSGPGNYSCQCQQPFHMAEDGTCQRSDEEVGDKVRYAVAATEHHISLCPCTARS